MPLAPGTHLGPYEIMTPLGAGGMGEVYRARDTRLERTVAIKVLLEQLSKDPTRKQRFEREAKTISSLNHPHICTLHDIGSQDGIDYLVMECVEGETLAKRLEKGPLPLEQVLKYGAQIADALNKAHRAGIVHRDLKPGNIMLTATGAKLLDFGLAKPAAAPVSGITLTATTPVTQEGTIAGTYQYMSPEQVEGKELDERSDIFSMGAVLYEMLTGQRAFEGKTQLSLASAILEKEPASISSIKPLTPFTLEHAVKKCLAKHPDDRWQSAADLASELGWIRDAGSQADLAGPVVCKQRHRERVAWVSAAVLLVLAAAFGLGYLRRPQRQERAMHFFIALPSSARDLTLSPDSRNLAFIAPRPNGGGNLLWVQEIGSTGAHIVENTEGASYPFWSPDNHFIGFFADGKLKKIDAAGGAVQVLCDALFGRGGTWNNEDTIVFAPNSGGGLARVSASGGSPLPITEIPAGAPHFLNLSHRWPSFLPDGKHFLYSMVDFTDPRSDANAIYIGVLDSKEQRRLVTSNSNAIYVPDYLVFSKSGTLMAHRFDADRLQLAGVPFAVANDVEYLNTVARAHFSGSPDGTLVYQSGSHVILSELQWFDRNGKWLATLGAPAKYANPRISPNGGKVAVDIDDRESNLDIWFLDVKSGVGSRFTFDPATDETPIWSSDGSSVLWMSQRRGGNNFYVKGTTSSGKEEAVPQLSQSLLDFPTDWSPDGHLLLYTATRDDWVLQMRVLPMTGVEPKSSAFTHSESTETQGQFSPDGHWVAYSSNESGRWQVYVAPFPGPGGKYQISTEGGQQPRWRRDGKELFFLSPDKKLMAGAVKAGAIFEFGTPTVLFQTRAREPNSSEEVFTNDVSPDGQRFLINVNLEQSNPPPANIVLNWSFEPRK